MNKVIILLSFLLCAGLLVQGAIPMKEQGVIEQTVESSIEQAAEPRVEKTRESSKVKKMLKKLWAKYVGPYSSNEGSGVYSILALSCALLGILLTAATGFLGIPFFIAAVVLGIIGLTRGEKFKGLAIAGICIGGLGLLALIALIGVLIALFGF